MRHTSATPNSGAPTRGLPRGRFNYSVRSAAARSPCPASLRAWRLNRRRTVTALRRSLIFLRRREPFSRRRLKTSSVPADTDRRRCANLRSMPVSYAGLAGAESARGRWLLGGFRRRVVREHDTGVIEQRAVAIRRRRHLPEQITRISTCQRPDVAHDRALRATRCWCAVVVIGADACSRATAARRIWHFVSMWKRRESGPRRRSARPDRKDSWRAG